MSTTEITATITGQVDTLAAIYDRVFRAVYAEVAEWRARYPRRSPYNSWDMAGAARMAGLVTKTVHGMPGTEYLDDALVVKHSRTQAELLTAKYAAKVEAKAEGMTDVKVSQMDAKGYFIVTGTKAGHAVEIRQSVVTKCSSKGTWFAQFPALVYIDGKRSTEKALLAL
jgi:hypothetical protein